MFQDGLLQRNENWRKISVKPQAPIPIDRKVTNIRHLALVWSDQASSFRRRRQQLLVSFSNSNPNEARLLWTMKTRFHDFHTIHLKWQRSHLSRSLRRIGEKLQKHLSHSTRIIPEELETLWQRSHSSRNFPWEELTEYSRIPYIFLFENTHLLTLWCEKLPCQKDGGYPVEAHANNSLFHIGKKTWITHFLGKYLKWGYNSLFYLFLLF